MRAAADPAPAPTLRIVADAAGVYAAAAAEVIANAALAMRRNGRFDLALSGGSTPRGLYRLLAEDAALRERFPWTSTHFFWGDERPVPPDAPESNYRMAFEAMLSKVPVPAAHVHRIEGERPAAAAAAAYAADLARHFGSDGAMPRFDLILLGLGDDGHTASLFPGTPALEERSAAVVANPVARLRTERITLTMRAINAARAVLVLVSGADKARALQGVLEGPFEPDRYPAQLLRPARGTLAWIADAAAASRLAA